MKIHVLSDLHLEIADYNVKALEADVIVLAGDIGVGMKGLEWAARLMGRTNAHIIYIAGNHEFYRYEMNSLRKAMKDFCSAPTGWEGDSSEHRLHFLDDDEVIINGVRFLGSTMWTDFMLFNEDKMIESVLEGQRRLNDYFLIRNGKSILRASNTIDLHKASVAWLEHKLKVEKFDGKTVVVTHHLPSSLSVADRFKDSLLSACYASNLDHLFGYSELWIHGHTHDSFDYVSKGTRVVCNPRGYCPYRNENDEFDPKLIVEI
jgi:predicted phosphodiesterase